MTTDDTLQQIGVNAFAAIKEMVAALQCDYERLEELREAANEYTADNGGRGGRNHWEADCKEDADELAELEAAAGDCESEEDARERIQEDPLSLEFRSDWVSSKSDMEISEYRLLLTTGGPAVQIVGDIEDGEATSARLQVQDWGTPWTEHILTGDDHDTLMAYVSVFYFGE
jgi:hypothetical protein